MDYINLDKISSIEKFSLIKNVQDNMFIEENKDGVIVDKDKKVFSSEDGSVFVKEFKVEPVKREQKIYNIYNIQPGDNMILIIRKFMENYPATRRYYTESQLYNEIISTNGLRGNFDSLKGIDSITIPVYIASFKNDDDLPEIEKHYVLPNEQFYYQIVLNMKYTADSTEIERLAKEMEKLNGTPRPTLMKEILVPGLEKYKKEHSIRSNSFSR